MNEKFIITVEYLESAQNGSAPTKDSTQAEQENEQKLEDLSVELSFEAMKVEYEYQRNRAARLDNKIYILLTVCAFLFTSFQSLFTSFNHKSMPDTSFEVFFLITGVIVIILLITLLILLLILLSPREYNWLDANEITSNIFYLKKEEVAKEICEIYQNSWNYNSQILNERNKKLSLCVFLITGVIILLFAMMLFVYYK